MDLSSVSPLWEANWWSSRWNEFIQSQSHTLLLERHRSNKSQSQALLPAAKLMLSVPHLIVTEHCSPASLKDHTKGSMHQFALPQERDEKNFSASSWNPSPIHRALEQKLKWETTPGTKINHSPLTGLTAAAQKRGLHQYEHSEQRYKKKKKYKNPKTGIINCTSPGLKIHLPLWVSAGHRAPAAPVVRGSCHLPGARRRTPRCGGRDGGFGLASHGRLCQAIGSSSYGPAAVTNASQVSERVPGGVLSLRSPAVAP